MSKGMDLLDELLKNPESFSEKGKPFQLLQEYYNGLPLESLSPLLKHENIYVKSAALFIVRELGTQADIFIDLVVPLLEINNRSVKYDALEYILVHSKGEYADRLINVLHHLRDDDEIIRVLSMRLLVNADEFQISKTLDLIEGSSLTESTEHSEFLKQLLDKELYEFEVEKMMNSENELESRYGAVMAKRFNYTRLIETYAGGNEDLEYFIQTTN